MSLYAIGALFPLQFTDHFVTFLEAFHSFTFKETRGPNWPDVFVPVLGDVIWGMPLFILFLTIACNTSLILAVENLSPSELFFSHYDQLNRSF